MSITYNCNTHPRHWARISKNPEQDRITIGWRLETAPTKTQRRYWRKAAWWMDKAIKQLLCK